MEKQIEYLRKMTDDFGMVQFSNKDKPDIKSGYTIDDVSRALIVSSSLGLEDLSETYFNFIKNAQISDGRFVNVYSGEKKPLENVGSQDSFGRTLWALGELLNKTNKGEEISYETLIALDKFGIHYPISEAFSLLGLTKMYEVGFEKKKTKNLIKKLSNSLIDRANKNKDKNWFWVLDEITYENARIPQALLRASNTMENISYYKYAKNLKDFLDKTVFEVNEKNENFINVIGNNTNGLGGTWYKKGKIKPKFDEQPVDVGGMVELHSEIYNLFLDELSLEKAKIALDWFNGKNRLNKTMISQNGGIYDGLGNEGVINSHQGAESLLAYMMAKIKFDNVKNGI